MQYYGWNIPYPILTSCDGDDIFINESHGVACRTGDTVEMILHLTRFQIKYNVNGEYQGIAFRNIERC